MCTCRSQATGQDTGLCIYMYMYIHVAKCCLEGSGGIERLSIPALSAHTVGVYSTVRS